MVHFGVAAAVSQHHHLQNREQVQVEQLLQASNKHRSGKESVEAVDPSAALAEARRRFLVAVRAAADGLEWKT